MEIRDAYNSDSSITNRELIRGNPIPESLYHIVTEILLLHADGDYLKMQC